MLDDSTQDGATTTSHIKRLIGLLKERRVLASELSTIWENNDGCEEQYICAFAINLMSVMYLYNLVIIYHGISATGHGKEVDDCLNAIDKRYIYQLVSNVQLT